MVVTNGDLTLSVRGDVNASAINYHGRLQISDELDTSPIVNAIPVNAQQIAVFTKSGSEYRITLDEWEFDSLFAGVLKAFIEHHMAFQKLRGTDFANKLK